MIKDLTKHDYWVCRDDEGLLHTAKVTRFFDASGHLTAMLVCTACRPRIQKEYLKADGHSALALPQVTLGNPWGKDRITLVEYRIREAPTCVRCAVASNVFDSGGTG